MTMNPFEQNKQQLLRFLTSQVEQEVIDYIRQEMQHDAPDSVPTEEELFAFFQSQDEPTTLDGMNASELLSWGLMFPTPLAADTGSRTRTERISISPNGAFRRKKRDGRYWSAGLSETIYFLTPVTDPSLRFNPEWVEWLMGFPQGWTEISSGA